MNFVGNVISAQEMYSSLEVKHLQLDSLGYAHCARLPTTGLFSACGPLYDTTISFFTSNYKDVIYLNIYKLIWLYITVLCRVPTT